MWKILLPLMLAIFLAALTAKATDVIDPDIGDEWMAGFVAVVFIATLILSGLWNALFRTQIRAGCTLAILLGSSGAGMIWLSDYLSPTRSDHITELYAGFTIAFALFGLASGLYLYRKPKKKKRLKKR